MRARLIPVSPKLCTLEVYAVMLLVVTGNQLSYHCSYVGTRNLMLFLFVGRVNLVDLQQTLNVDFSHIESKVNEIVSNDSNLIVVLGQLIDQ